MRNLHGQAKSPAQRCRKAHVVLAELDEVGGLLRAAGLRLLTLTWLGGPGKTRLALQVAHEVADAFADGVYFAGLEHIRDPGLVPSAIAHTLGLEERRDTPLAETLQAYLRTRRLLLCSTTSRSWTRPRRSSASCSKPRRTWRCL